MAERILHADGNGNFTIGSRGSSIRKTMPALRPAWFFLWVRWKGSRGNQTRTRLVPSGKQRDRPPLRGVRISLLAVSVEFASKCSGEISYKTKRYVAGVQDVKADADLHHEGPAGRGNVLSGHANACNVMRFILSRCPFGDPLWGTEWSKSGHWWAPSGLERGSIGARAATGWTRGIYSYRG